MTAPARATDAKVLDLNADLGEGVGDDAAMLALVTSANVACGGHAGGEDTMREVCERAAHLGVRIGAHVSYRDRANFGRVPVVIAQEELRAQLAAQLAELAEIASAAGARVTYVKPHGALYHAAASNPAHARAVVSVAGQWGLAVVGAPGALALELAAHEGLPTIAEAFADRAYQADGSLVPRGTEGAVLHDGVTIAARVAHLVRTGSIEAVDGTLVPLAVRTLCVHGDTPEAVAIATRVRAELERAGLAPVPFT